MNHRTLVLLLSCVALASCGGASDPVDPTVVVYKSLESLQCVGGGKSIEEIEALARAAGVHVRGSSCGVDGLVRAAVCGVGDGRIALLDIPHSQSQLAFANGFYSVQGVPVVQTACK